MASPPPLSKTDVTRQRWPWVLIVLIVVCVSIEAILLLGDHNVSFGPRVRSTVYEYTGFWPGLLDNWRPNYPLQPYTMFITYAFVHNGVPHLLFNMVTLYSLGRVVIDRVGTFGFVLLYAGAVLGGALGFGLLADTTQPMVGASGGLFGLVGGILSWNYVDRFTTRQRLAPVLQAACALLLLNLVIWWLMNGLLAWETHLGGFLAGWATALLIDPRSAENETDDPQEPTA